MEKIEKLFDRVFNIILDKKERLLNNKVNCIPCPFKRLSSEWPGIEQGRYYLISAQSKVGKSQITNYLFLFNSIFYAIKNPDKIRVKFFYFSLEISQEELYLVFLSHLLYILSKETISVSPKDLKSTSSLNPISDEILTLLKSEEYKKYTDFFDENVIIIDSIRNPTGIFGVMKEYSKNNGKQYKKVIDFVNKETGEITPTEVDDYYQPNDPDEYVFCIIDHVSLIQPESGLNLRDSITKLSSEYLIKLRNKYGYIPVIIQQQAAAGESNENVKMGRVRPSPNDLGDNKLTIRDCNLAIGLFSPFKHELQEYMHYDITKFKDNIRFLEIMVSRDGGGGSVIPLFFNGKCNYFKELPLPHDKAGLQQVYNLLETIRQKTTVSLHLFNIKKEENYVKNFRISKKRIWKNIFNWFNSTVRNYRIRS